MSAIDKEGADHAAEYIGVIRGVWPLVCIAGAIALASAIHQLKRGYKQRTTSQKIVTVILNTLLTTALAVSCALLLPIFLPDGTPEIKLAVSICVAGVGGESIKQLIIKKLGLSVVDLMNPNDINDIRLTMDSETRKKHAEQCPFKKDECK